MPPVVLERPKMSRAMWEALKSHIMKERQRKKQGEIFLICCVKGISFHSVERYLTMLCCRNATVGIKEWIWIIDWNNLTFQSLKPMLKLSDNGRNENGSWNKIQWHWAKHGSKLQYLIIGWPTWRMRSTNCLCNWRKFCMKMTRDDGSYWAKSKGTVGVGSFQCDS